MEWKMKRVKFTKTKIEELPHPTGTVPDKYFASNCSNLCLFVHPKPSLKKSYYAQWGKILINPDGTQKRTGRYKYICRFNDKTVEAVMAEVKAKIKDWKKERDQSSRKNTVATLVKEFIAGASAGYRIKKKGGKIKYKKKTTQNYNSVLSAYVLVKTKDSDLRDRLTAPFRYESEYVTGALKDLPLNKVTKKDVEIWHNRLESTPTVANRALSYLSVVFEWDMRRSTNRLYKSDANPCSRISHYVEKKHKDYLKLPKVLEVRNYCMQEQWRDPHFLTFYCMLLECGERLEDLFKLLWQRPKTVAEEKQCSGWIDFEKNEIYLTDTKNRQDADIGMTDELHSVVDKLLKLKIEVGSRAAWAVTSKWVFPRATDPSLPINNNSYRVKLQKFNYKFDLATREYVRGKGKRIKYKYKNLYSFKNLRKTFATHYGRKHGVEKTSQRMRHSNTGVTKDHYFNESKADLNVKHVYSADSAPVIEFKKKEQK